MFTQSLRVDGASTGFPDIINVGKDLRQANPDRFSITVLQTAAAIRRFAPEWEVLEAQTNSHDLFQSWAWCEVILEHKKNDAQFEPFIVVVRCGAEVQGILPLGLGTRFGQKILTGFAEPYQQYTELLCKNAVSPGDIFEAMLPAIRSSGADLMHLGQVRENGVLFEAIKEKVSPSGEMDSAPYVQLSNWQDFEDYFSTLKAKTRKNMRNARNRLSKSDELSHEFHRSGDGFTAVVQRTFKQRAEWLKRTGLTSRAFSDDEFSQLLDRLATIGESENCKLQFLAMSLKHGDKQIAEQWGFVHKGCYYAFMSGWDFAYEAVSPGKLHLEDVLRTCYELGLDKADFMIPAVPYKQTWTRSEVTVQDYVLPISFTGRVYNNLWLNFMRPWAKYMYYKIPREWRARLFGQAVS
ncbi:MAG: GNAT family N-acetyltransferase [Rhizobiaceae bacterium]|nr:GNAT family N-acetyltransferase [Rhizobiaceae bacterium]